MRERSLDEFESIFEKASIPVLDIERVSLSRVAVVAMGDGLDESVALLAKYLHSRFGCSLAVHCPSNRSADVLTTRLQVEGIEVGVQAFSSTAELVGQISIGRSQLIVLPITGVGTEKAVDLDAMIEGTKPPVLLIRQPVPEPKQVFARILHCLSGNFQQKQNFAFSFTLAETNGALILFHVVDQTELDDVRETLRVAPGIVAEEGKELIEELATHGERYLKGVVAAAREEPFEVMYRLTIGEIAPAVEVALKADPISLLVVGSHHEGHSHVSASDYRLMHEVTEIPILAL